MVIKEATRFGAKEVREYHEKGYYFPVKALAEEEILMFKEKFLNHLAETRGQREKLSSRDQYVVFSETHTYLNWVYRIVSHPNVLDAVEAILGPNLMVWGSRWFAKMPGEKTYVSWHQDATYWGLHPPNVTTAWIALSYSILENGCMRVIPGTHRGDLLPQRETYAPENALSRGQEIAVEVDESQAVDLTLRPGEMSFHHIGIVHGSNVNKSDKPRIGIAVRYITPDVVQEGPERSLAMLVRGEDGFGHFELVEPPQTDTLPTPGQIPKAVDRMMKNIMPKAPQPSPGQHASNE
ncbi:MAG TPA: phytanoyl-CoA dioxygenase family protein [Terriglobia bacterium]|nr:phytanoyl-CoA dioxygenase family protein [Terriglobia bacterium]